MFTEKRKRKRETEYSDGRGESTVDFTEKISYYK